VHAWCHSRDSRMAGMDVRPFVGTGGSVLQRERSLGGRQAGRPAGWLAGSGPGRGTSRVAAAETLRKGRGRRLFRQKKTTHIPAWTTPASSLTPITCSAPPPLHPDPNLVRSGARHKTRTSLHSSSTPVQSCPTERTCGGPTSVSLRPTKQATTNVLTCAQLYLTLNRSRRSQTQISRV
jgi:hypothetical protein